MTNCGIYQIKNTRNGKIYVGSTKNLKTRETQHFYELNKKTHRNAKLQRAYLKESESFVFEVLLICSEENLLMYEQAYFDAWSPEYNISPQAGRIVWDEERKVRHGAIISSLQRGKIPTQFQTLSARIKQSKTMSEKLKGKIPLQMHTEEARRKAAVSCSTSQNGIHRDASRLHTAEVISKRSKSFSISQKGKRPEHLFTNEVFEKKKQAFKSNMQFICRCSWYSSSIHWQKYWGA